MEAHTGDAREVICNATEKYNPDMLVLGCPKSDVAFSEANAPRFSIKGETPLAPFNLVAFGIEGVSWGRGIYSTKVIQDLRLVPTARIHKHEHVT